MNWTSFECPGCSARYRFLLDLSKEQHLRRCPDCDRWFIAHRDSADSEHEYRLDPLDHPPACPIDSCGEVLSPEELPAHIIENHGASLV